MADTVPGDRGLSDVPGNNRMADRDAILERFLPISLSDLHDATLMERKEQKFLLTYGEALYLLENLEGEARILEIEGKRVGLYETMYYDTWDYSLYRDHHNGKKNRYKLRTRHYLVSDLLFFEVKQKKNTGETKKERIGIKRPLILIDEQIRSFLSSHVPCLPEELQPVIRNTYERVTLVFPETRERVTFDFALSYEHDGHGIVLPDVVITEIKTAGKITHSPVSRLARGLHKRPTGFSKYCIGISLLCPEVKKNRFKPKINRIMAMTGGSMVTW